MATFAMEQAAAAAAAKTSSLLPLLLPCFSSLLPFSPSAASEALATITPLRAVVEGSLVQVELVLGRREAVMLIEAMSATWKWHEKGLLLVTHHPFPYPKKCWDKWVVATCGFILAEGCG
ncbi:hypothetical protein QQP08_025162 [Theobroma cacao]|nr:hypothetical protein QQP08_025162 [Theobroma cacao]